MAAVSPLLDFPMLPLFGVSSSSSCRPSTTYLLPLSAYPHKNKTNGARPRVACGSLQRFGDLWLVGGELAFRSEGVRVTGLGRRVRVARGDVSNRLEIFGPSEYRRVLRIVSTTSPILRSDNDDKRHDVVGRSGPIESRRSDAARFAFTEPPPPPLTAGHQQLHRSHSELLSENVHPRQSLANRAPTRVLFLEHGVLFTGSRSLKKSDLRACTHRQIHSHCILPELMRL